MDTPTPSELPNLAYNLDTCYKGATGDQCIIAFSVYCHAGSILWLSELEHISGTNLVQRL